MNPQESFSHSGSQVISEVGVFTKTIIKNNHSKWHIDCKKKPKIHLEWFCRVWGRAVEKLKECVQDGQHSTADIPIHGFYGSSEALCSRFSASSTKVIQAYHSSLQKKDVCLFSCNSKKSNLKSCGGSSGCCLTAPDPGLTRL